MLSQSSSIGCTIIGGGVIGTSLADGLLGASVANSKTKPASTNTIYHVRLTTRRGDHAAELRKRYPDFFVTKNNRDSALWGPHAWPLSSVPAVHVVLICTQPQYTQDVCDDLRAAAKLVTTKIPTVFVTVCPGISVATLESWLPQGAGIVRTMPNTPVCVAEGATAAFANGAAKSRPETVAAVTEMFHLMSPAVCFVPEEGLMDVAASVSGSAPAYVFTLLESMVEAGVRRGLPRDLAVALVTQSGFGSALLALKGDNSLRGLVENVCVPGGSTERAMDALRRRDFAGAVDDGVEVSLRANRAMGHVDGN
ncbi:pyrroline-5-carboxylate reductase [Apodospora peruviana]|uniref:Pyrroline-5-carboxylate reductase n=1 Tax=Apodospora peruviana TaxID=516989 RepID=A0AAE0M8I9_9PEZI|nr:pyrroline-5-carboxylate reductase [Apodospora peruviana]